MSRETTDFCEVIIIRHGETDWNHAGIIQGREDIPMNAKGYQQIEATARELGTVICTTPGTFTEKHLNPSSSLTPLGITAMYTSPLCRAKGSAELIAQRIGFSQGITVEECLSEWNAGIIQGTPLRDIPLKFPDIWQKWKTNRDPYYRFPGGESFIDRYNRVVEGVQRLATKHAGRRIVIVCHAGVIDDVYRRAQYVPHSQNTRLAKHNGGIFILHIETLTSSTGHFGMPEWKILRWGTDRCTHENPNRNATDNSGGADGHETAIIYA